MPGEIDQLIGNHAYAPDFVGQGMNEVRGPYPGEVLVAGVDEGAVQAHTQMMQESLSHLGCVHALPAGE